MRNSEKIKLIQHVGRNNGERYVRINELMLDNPGMDFETAHKEVVGTAAGASQLRTYSRTEIINENRVNFDMVMNNRLLPYERIVEAMEAVDANGKPDWKTQLAAVKQFAQMYGLDPRTSINVNIGSGPNFNISVGQMLNLTRIVTDEEDRLRLYNEIKMMERQGMLNVSPGRTGELESMVGNSPER